MPKRVSLIHRNHHILLDCYIHATVGRHIILKKIFVNAFSDNKYQYLYMFIIIQFKNSLSQVPIYVKRNIYTVALL